MARQAATEREQVEVRSRTELRDWLSAHHTRSGSVWLVTYKKSQGDLHVPYDVIVNEALCFGWIDSLPRKLEEARTMVLLSPRKPQSAWSRVNRDRVERLIRDGRMTSAGQAVIEAAKASGAWERLAEIDDLAVPGDLAAAFKDFPGSAENFAAFPPSTRRGILEWILQAKRSDTRRKRVIETASLAAENIRANQFRR